MVINPENLTRYCALVIHIDKGIYDKFEEFCKLNSCTPIDALRHFIHQAIKSEIMPPKKYFDIDFYVSLKYELEKQSDYHFETFGETDEYLEYCERIGKLEKLIRELEEQKQSEKKDTSFG